VIKGNVEVFGETLETGDGIAIEDAPDAFDVKANAETEFLLFRLN
jgi:redox-sensitive bicupin YhaK (pirin superfamily)